MSGNLKHRHFSNKEYECQIVWVYIVKDGQNLAYRSGNTEETNEINMMYAKQEKYTILSNQTLNLIVSVSICCIRFIV